jgi:hypothetical protein
MYGLSLVASIESAQERLATPSPAAINGRSKPIRIRVLALRAGGRGRADLAVSRLAASRAETLVSEV